MQPTRASALCIDRQSKENLVRSQRAAKVSLLKVLCDLLLPLKNFANFGKQYLSIHLYKSE